MKNKSLPVPLKEFNTLCESVSKFARMSKGRVLTATEADKRAREMMKRDGFTGGVEGDRTDLRESQYQKLGLSPEAARIAAKVETEDFAKVDWVETFGNLTAGKRR
jgi:hypothetical protein